MTCDKNLFKEFIKINIQNVKFCDDQKERSLSTTQFHSAIIVILQKYTLWMDTTIIFWSKSQLCDSGYEVKFKKKECAIEDELCKIILPRKRYGNVYMFMELKI